MQNSKTFNEEIKKLAEQAASFSEITYDDRFTSKFFEGKVAGYEYALKQSLSQIRLKREEIQFKAINAWQEAAGDRWGFHFHDGFSAALTEVIAMHVAERFIPTMQAQAN